MFATKLVFIFSVGIKCVVQSARHEKESGSGSGAGSACNKINWFFFAFLSDSLRLFPAIFYDDTLSQRIYCYFRFCARCALLKSTIIWLAQREYACMSLGNSRWFDCCVCKLFGPNKMAWSSYTCIVHITDQYIQFHANALQIQRPVHCVCVCDEWMRLKHIFTLLIR